MIEFEAVFAAIVVSLRVAFSTVFILLLVGVPIAYRLAMSKSRLKPLWESLVSLPIALPPTVVGFYWLLVFGRGSLVGEWLYEVLGGSLVFSFLGVVLGSSLYCLPFMVQPVKNGFEAVPQELLDNARLDGASSVQVFLRICLPMSLRSITVGASLTVVHALGEFGVVMMIGGNITSETRTASIALYDAVQALQFREAHMVALVLLFLAMVASVPMFWSKR